MRGGVGRVRSRDRVCLDVGRVWDLGDEVEESSYMEEMHDLALVLR